MKKRIKYTKESPKKHSSWQTSDEHEIGLRAERAKSEKMKAVRLPGAHAVFTKYTVVKIGSQDARTYNVEVRSLSRKINTCDCDDYRKNFLGTCKHIEKVLLDIPRRARTMDGSPFIEIFVSPHDRSRVEIEIPVNLSAPALKWINQYLTESKELRQPYYDTMSVMLRDLPLANAKISGGVRISKDVFSWLENAAFSNKLARIRDEYEQGLHASGGKIDFLKIPLYDYQIKGMLHLAFNGRAMLTDEMGLGKTVQAIAAACALKEMFGIRRVLVISPASLKTEWEEQICKFTDTSYSILYGNRSDRLNFYSNCKTFFILSNYEQAIRDQKEIISELQPDLIILDEAQRIKNWRTKTARTIKGLRSKFAFILTGTPLENRIDELYSIVEFINPEIFGSLFRFNRRFYEFNSDGKVTSYKNLKELHEVLKPVMLRRRKDDIDEQLPERIDNNYFVKMTPEQHTRYEEYAYPVSILMKIAEKRPLSNEELDRLQRNLSCMRMLCDSVYILDSKIIDSPKIEELVKILEDIWDDEPQRKIVIFSEWVRMLDLVETQLEKNGVGYAVHTGSIPQAKRRTEINRFKNDSDCKVFLSSDSGGVGLNLQAASVIINLDLPWNPARLEQRIARIWRKHQKNRVNVINIISEHTIEHKMLATLAFKQELADGVLDGRGDIARLEKPDAKSGFLKRLSEIMKVSYYEGKTEGSSQSKPSLKERLVQDFKVKFPELNVCGFLHEAGVDTPKSLFAVTSGDLLKTEEKIISSINLEENNSNLTQNTAVIDSKTYGTLRRLEELGIISFNQALKMEIELSDEQQNRKTDDFNRRRKLAEPLVAESARKLKMSIVLAGAGFETEAIRPAAEALHLAGRAFWNLTVADINESAIEALDPGETALLIDKYPELKRHFANLAFSLAGDLTLDSGFAESASILTAEAEKIIRSEIC